MNRRLLAILITTSLLTGCMVGPKYQRPGVQTPTVYRGVENPTTPPDPQSLGNSKWFDVFSDDALRELIRQALTGNYDLREAVARLGQAEANYGIVRSNQFPKVEAGANWTVQGLSRDGQFSVPEPIKRTRTWGSIFLGLLTFEVDVWGRLRSASASARAQMLASEEIQKAVLTTLVSDVATAYFNLRELDLELDIERRTLAAREESLRIIRSRAERGVSNALELRQAEQLVYGAAASIPDTQRAIEQQENFIRLLLGMNPEGIPRGLALTEQAMPPVPAGLPSDLIERRPDIRAAEQNLISANALIGVAKAAYFPRITLTGFAGFQSAQLSTLFNGSRSIWSFTPQVTQPIFYAGELKSGVKFSEAQKEAFLANYERTIQTAFREVSDSLIAHRRVREVRVQAEQLVKTLTDRSRLAYLRYNYGVSNLLEALDADRDLFEGELRLAQIRRDELLTVVQLYKALGGGWQV